MLPLWFASLIAVLQVLSHIGLIKQYRMFAKRGIDPIALTDDFWSGGDEAILDLAETLSDG